VTPIAAMVKAMLEKGVAHDAIVIAVEGAEQVLINSASAEIRGQSVDVQAEKRREKDRIRKQLARGIPQKSADVRRNPQMSENASLSKESKKEEIREERGRMRANVRGQRLPEDWAPSLPDTAIADEMLGGPERRNAELEKFRDHWKQQPGGKGVKLDWNAAWRNWIRRAAEYRGGMNGNGNHAIRTNTGAQQSGSASVLAGVAAATERRARERSAAGQQRPLPNHTDPAPRDDLELFGSGDRPAPHR